MKQLLSDLIGAVVCWFHQRHVDIDCTDSYGPARICLRCSRIRRS